MLIEIILLLVGFALLIYGAEILVKGASTIAEVLGMSPILVGLTVVAFGTSAPELFVSAQAALMNKVDVSVGNVIGSNICNVLGIIGLALLVMPLHIAESVRKKDTPLMLATMAIFWFAAWDGTISRIEGAAFFVGILLYLYISYKQHEHDVLESESTHELSRALMMKNIVLILIGLVGLVFGADLIVANAVKIAKSFHVSDLIIGITVVAIGTSLPECAATIVAAKKNQGNMALGNAVGSNVFNVLCVLGITAMIVPLPVSQQALSLDLPFMFLAAFVVTATFWFKGNLGRRTGVSFILLYAAYIVYLAMIQGGPF